MEKAGLGAGFFLLAMGCGGMDFRKYAVAAVGSDGFAAFWHLNHQIRLSAWLWDEKRLTPPSGTGNWESLFNGIYRLQQRHRKKRKELTNLIRRFRNGAESLPDAVVVFRSEGNIVWCNRLAQHLLGFRWPDDAGQPISNLLRTPDFIKYLKKMILLIRSKCVRRSIVIACWNCG